MHRQDEFLEYDYDDMVEMIEAECDEDESDGGWDELEYEDEDDEQATDGEADLSITLSFEF